MAATIFVWILGGAAAIGIFCLIVRVIDFVIDSSERWEG